MRFSESSFRFVIHADDSIICALSTRLEGSWPVIHFVVALHLHVPAISTKIEKSLDMCALSPVACPGRLSRTDSVSAAWCSLCFPCMCTLHGLRIE